MDWPYRAMFIRGKRWIRSLLTQYVGWSHSRWGLPLCPTWPCFPPPNGPKGNQSFRTWWSGACCGEQKLTPSWFYLADILGPRGVLAPCQLFILPVTLYNCYRLWGKQEEKEWKRKRAFTGGYGCWLGPSDRISFDNWLVRLHPGL